MPPSSDAAAANNRCTSSSCVTSHGMPGTPSALADSPSRRSCLSLITTRAPSSMQRFAVANPIPVPAGGGDEHALALEQRVPFDVRRGSGHPDPGAESAPTAMSTRLATNASWSSAGCGPSSSARARMASVSDTSASRIVTRS